MATDRDLFGRNLGSAAQAGDAVWTPDWCAADMVAHFKPIGRILEPCRGGGAFMRHLPSDALWCEITEDRDFFDWRAQSTGLSQTRHTVLRVRFFATPSLWPITSCFCCQPGTFSVDTAPSGSVLAGVAWPRSVGMERVQNSIFRWATQSLRSIGDAATRGSSMRRSMRTRPAPVECGSNVYNSL